jgi:hypothetical protein
MATATLTLPPRRITRELVCTYDKLSKRAKENAREWMRELEQQDFDTEFIFEDARTVAGILGIEFNVTREGTADIRYSGFCSQGDGASFVGTYSHKPQSPANIRKEYPDETRLHAIADGLDLAQNTYRLLTGRRFTATVTQSGNYYHKYSMSLELEDGDDPDGDDSRLNLELETRVLNLMRDFAEWIYRSLEQEYDYRLSDEAIEETIRANDYKFQAATGKVV